MAGWTDKQQRELAAVAVVIGRAQDDGTNNVRPMTHSHDPLFLSPPSPCERASEQSIRNQSRGRKPTKRPEGRARNAREKKGSQAGKKHTKTSRFHATEKNLARFLG
jgi:hypothetical protein